MDIFGKRQEGFDIHHMLVLIQHTLIKVGYGPSLGNIKIKELCKLVSGLPRYSVSPGSEGDHQLVLIVKYHIAVHHGRYPYGASCGKRHPVFFLYVLFQTCVAVLNSSPDVIQTVGPDAVFQPVFPAVFSRCQYLEILSDEHRLYVRGSELNAKCGLSGFNSFLCSHVPFSSLKCLIYLSLNALLSYEKFLQGFKYLSGSHGL